MQFGIDRLLQDSRLYGEERRPPDAMREPCDLLRIDLQDLGCRIDPFVTKLCFVLEAAARLGRSVWQRDRPDPAGRPVEGLRLVAGALFGAEPLRVG